MDLGLRSLASDLHSERCCHSILELAAAAFMYPDMRGLADSSIRVRNITPQFVSLGEGWCGKNPH